MAAPASGTVEDPHLLAHRLIRRYLNHVGYAQTLEAFERDARAAGYDLSAGSEAGAADPATEHEASLLDVTESYISQQESLRKATLLQAKQDLALSVLSQTLPGPSTLPYQLHARHSALHTSNILSIRALLLPRRSFDTRAADYRTEWQRCLVTTAADRRVVFCDPASGEMREVFEGIHKAAVLDVAQVGDGAQWPPDNPRPLNSVSGRLLASAGMDGSVVLYDCLNGAHVQTLRNHSKFVVRVAFESSGRYLASAGYDRRINIYRAVGPSRFFDPHEHSPDRSNGADEGMGDAEEPEDLAVQYELAHTIETPSNPEALLFLPPKSEHADTDGHGAVAAGDARGWLVYTIRGDCFLHYVALPSLSGAAQSASASTAATSTMSLPPDSLEARLQKLNVKKADSQMDVDGAHGQELADWEEVQYNTNPSPDDLHVSYSLLDIALHPSGLYISAVTGDHAVSSTLSQASAGGGGGGSPTSLSRILLMPLHSDARAATLWTGAPCSAYASPRHAWLPSGRAAWVNGEDGSVRLVDLRGKVRAVVHAHGQAQQQQGAGADELSAAVAWRSGGGGNTIVKDVVALDEHTVASCGFDRTVRICRIAE